MTTKNRKPMTFDIDRSPQTVSEAIPPDTKPKMSASDKQQVGARIPSSKYRQLKARAALEGVKVQSLVEQAIDQFLAAKP